MTRRVGQGQGTCGFASDRCRDDRSPSDVPRLRMPLVPCTLTLLDAVGEPVAVVVCDGVAPVLIDAEGDGDGVAAR